MNIRVINSGEKIVMKLSGYLDAFFAWEIVRKVENYKDKEVVLDFKEIRHVHAFGWDALKARIGPKVIFQNIDVQILKREGVFEEHKGHKGF